MQHAPPPPVCMMARVYWTLLTLITVHVWLVTQARDVNMVSDQSALHTLVLYIHSRLQNYWQNMRKNVFMVKQYIENLVENPASSFLLASLCF